MTERIASVDGVAVWSGEYLDWLHCPRWTRQGGGRAWYGGGFTTLEQTYEALEHGWPGGCKPQREAIGEIQAGLPEVVTRKRVRARGPVGDELLPDRYLACDWDRCWLTRRRQSRRSHVGAVTVACNGGALASVHADAYVWRGAAALALVDALETAGYRVTVLLAAEATHVGSASGFGGNAATYVRLHSPGDPVSPDVIAGALGLAGAHRTATFATRVAMMRARTVRNVRRTKAFMGYTKTVSATEIESRAGELVDGPVLVIQNVWSAADARGTIARALGTLEESAAGVP